MVQHQATLSLFVAMDTYNNFLEELENNALVKSAILFGSRARGDARPDSDYDLVVICNETKRDVVRRDGLVFEIVYVTEQDAVDFYRSHKDDCVRKWKVAKILFDKDGSADRLKSIAHNIEAAEKQPMSSEQIKHALFDAEDQLRAIAHRVDRDPVTAAYLLQQKVVQLAETYFDVRGVWTPAPKQILDEIKREDEDLYQLFVEFYQADEFSENIKNAQYIVNKIFCPQ